MRTGFKIGIVMASFALMASAQSAEAGRVKRTVGGIHKASGGKSRGGGASRHRGSSGRSGHVHTRGHRASRGPGFGFGWKPGPAHVEAYAGASKIYESDDAVAFDLGVADPSFGVTARLVGYREAVGDPRFQDTPLTVWEIVARRRLAGDVKSSIWLEAGAAGLHTTATRLQVGGEAGLTVETSVDGGPRLFAAGRGYVFDRDLTAIGAHVGVQIGILRAGVRVLDFNVGPALFGPEVGLGFGF